MNFGTVTIATTYGQSLPFVFARSWTKLILGKREGDDIWLPDKARTVDRQRNLAAASFLMRYPHCDTLFFVDTDIVCTDADLNRLRDNPNNADYDVVCGLVPYRKVIDPPPMMLRHIGENMHGLVYEGVSQWKDGETVAVDACTTAFTLIRRRVLEAMVENDNPMDSFFFVIDKRNSEDVTFSYRARQLGFRLGCDTSVSVGHLTATVARVKPCDQTQLS